MSYKDTNEFQPHNSILLKVNIIQQILIDMSATSWHIFRLTEKVNTEFNKPFKNEENITEKTGTYNTDVIKLVRVIPTDFPEIAISQRLLHHTLSAKINPTQVRESIEGESDDWIWPQIWK